MAKQNPGTKLTVSLATATLLIIANAIGTGIFTTTGFALADLKNPYLVLGVWIFGAAYSLVGVACYEELHKLYPGSGGEYHFLSRGLHRTLGSVAGWITLIAGFSAPIATSAMAFALYSNRFLGESLGAVPPLVLASLLVMAVFTFHAFLHSSGLKVHDAFVWGKLFGIALLVLVPAFVVDWRWPEAYVMPEAGLPTKALAQSFFWVAFSFSGWNAVYYVASELSGNRDQVRKASYLGTLGVCAVYLAINVLLLFGSDVSQLSGAPEVVAVFLENTFGPSASRWLSFLIAFGLISTTSAFFITGPRVYSRMAEDGALPRFFYAPTGVLPRRSIFLQAGVALAILWSLQFDKILSMTGFTLSLCSALAVSVLLFKIKATRMKFYVALVFCLVTFWLAYQAAPAIFG